MTAGEVRREIYLKNGVVVQAGSRLAEEALGQILVDMSIISSIERDEVLEQAAAEGRMIGDVLIETGLLTPMGVAEALAEQVRLRVANCLRLEDYDAKLTEGLTAAIKFQVNLSVPALLLRSVPEAVAPERMRAHLSLEPASRFGVPVSLEEALAGLELGPRETRMVRSLAGGTFASLADSEAEKEALLALVYTLWALGRIVVLPPRKPEKKEGDEQGPAVAGAEAPPDAIPPPASSTGRPEAPSSPGARSSQKSVRSSDVQRRQLIEKLRGSTSSGAGRSKAAAGALEPKEAVVDAWLRADRQDYFSLFGLSRDAGPSDVTIAYGAMLRRFRLENPPEDWPPRSKEAAAGLLARAGLAFAVLTDSKERKAYREHLEKGGGSFTPADPMVLVGAALRTADRLTSRGRFEDAISELRKAESSFPKEPAVHLALGRTFYEWTVKQGAAMENSAAQSLAAAARLDPALDGPWLFLGLLARHRRDDDHARKMFRKALSVNPRNERAASELASLEPEKGLLGKLFGK